MLLDNRITNTGILTESDMLIIPNILSEIISINTNSINRVTSIHENLTRRIYESKKYEDNTFLTEGLKDFIGDIITSLKILLDYLKELVNKLIIYLEKIFKSNKDLIKQNEKRINTIKIPEDKPFSFNGFKYTIHDNIPDIYAMQSYIVEIEKEISDAELINIDRDKVINLKDSLHNEYYDEVRGRIASLKIRVSEDDYYDELFKLFRDGKNFKTDIKVDNFELNRIHGEFQFHDEIIKDIKQTMIIIEKQYTRFIEYFKHCYDVERKLEGNVLSINDTKYSVDYQKLENFVNYMKLRSIQAEKILRIYNIAFTSKLQSVKDRHEQNIMVLKSLLVSGVK